MFAGGGAVLNDGRKGSLHLIVSIHGTPACPTDNPALVSCVEGTAPNGAWTRLLTEKFDDIITYSGLVGLPDGRWLAVSLTNEYGPDGAGATQRDTPWAGEQVLAVAVAVAGQVRP